MLDLISCLKIPILDVMLSLPEFGSLSIHTFVYRYLDFYHCFSFFVMSSLLGCQWLDNLRQLTVLLQRLPDILRCFWVTHSVTVDRWLLLRNTLCGAFLPGYARLSWWRDHYNFILNRVLSGWQIAKAHFLDDTFNERCMLSKGSSFHIQNRKFQLH